MKYDIIIVGAGAAGLVAAYRAITKNPQLNILVLEKEAIPGRKLNASGNGKCNLTNSNFNVDCYHSDSEKFIAQWCQQHTYIDLLSFFEDMGILLYEKNGYYYPVSNQAKQVSQLLYEKSSYKGVKYRFDTRVKEIEVNKHQQVTYFDITAVSDGKIIHATATNVIISTGGYASSKLGGCKDGYHFAQKMGIGCNPIYPVLSPIYVEDKELSIAKGVRIDGMVTLRLPNGTVKKEFGQIQFNDNNLSGIVMMNHSSYLNHNKNAISDSLLHIDVLPQVTWDALKTFFIKQKELFPKETLEHMLKGILPSNFVLYLCKRLKLERNMAIVDLTDKQANRLTSTLKKLEFIPVYVEDYERAQVTGGGISTDAISVDTFESKQYKNLYIVGEVLDVNGKCGGYNLTFAMLSALQAVDHIVKHIIL